MPSPFIELEVGERVVKVTNPDKVLFPAAGQTKRDLVDYYLAVGEGIVRALYERPTQLRRFPDGIEGEEIYQKRVPEKRPEWVEAARVTFPSGRHADELCVTELAQVVWAANLAVVDFHPWPSRRADTEHPDELRIDIDPQPGTDFGDGEARGGDRARGAGGDRLHRLAEDVRQPRHPRRLPDRAEVGVPGRAARRARVRARDRAARAGARDDRVVEGGAGREGLHRLQPERARPDDRLGLLGARAARRGRLGARHLGRAAGRRDRGLHARHDAGALRRSSATCRRRSTTRCATCASCSSGSSATRPPGVGEAPYPPNFPKMPGEPPRVQPSRARPKE